MHSSAYQPQSGPWIPPRTPCPLSVHGPRSSPYTGTAGASELALCGDSSKRHRGELQDSERRPERRGFSEKGAHWLPCCLAKGRMKSRFFWCAPAVLTLRPWQSAEPHCVENDRSDKMPSEVPSCCKIVLFLQNKQDNPTKPAPPSLPAPPKEKFSISFRERFFASLDSSGHELFFEHQKRPNFHCEERRRLMGQFFVVQPY
ncbi:uncharacterized protein LOC102485732 isoform X2 [Tupaia chinensis]|uniref:uncharacterized protein LOC102485732 isoform X1 n=1 Tax=Tupaia chinensis TaxID=246437 RepID=UPI0003C8C785|nr:uncharacterized protein LOC102485732 isoform X1 [Tupaia chinensis]XP_006150020.1 uncharacterized protein LOC102485732 isoform X2 [Tupaia chinensis]